MEKSDNPYRILGLTEDADEATIKKAYFKLARKCHPDKQTCDADHRQAATEEFAKIADAYDLLQDPVRRYDWRQANQGGTRTSSPSAGRKQRPVRSLSSGRKGSGPKRASSLNQFSSPSIPLAKKASVQANSVRVSPVSVTQSSIRVPTVRSTTSPVSQGRNSGGRSPVRNSGRSPPTRASTIVPGRNAARKPLLDNDSRGRAPVGRMSTCTANNTQSMNRASPAPGRKKTRTSSVGRKPSKQPKNNLDTRSEHGPRKPVGERRRRLKKTGSYRSVDTTGASTFDSARSRKH
ncbi:unnamed protein product [Cylindrotheca closterium]|uniref:J domain-containing protein n=1 Tax=Cylindrotheca closterium TaxID=2856 RepID=A0AAD2FW61_9STRA|nr:unnamed protein product [Cylindrotheca closterium]